MSTEIMDHVYGILQGVRSSSSGRGTSYYGMAATCGMKAKLYELFPFEESESEEIGATTPTGRRKANGKRAGVFFHALQQHWRTGSMVDNIVASAEHEDYDFELAVQSFANYRRFYKENRNNRGRVIDAEVHYPRNDEEQALVRAALGAEFTMRYDLKVYMDEADCEKLLLERGIYVKPGYWLVDYKLLASIGAQALDEYRRGFQGLAYPLVHNICTPDPAQHVLGTLFDITARVKTAEAKHFEVVLAELPSNALDIVRQGVQYGLANLTSGAANPLACFGKYGECHWSKTGRCPKYGTFEQHKTLFITQGK